MSGIFEERWCDGSQFLYCRQYRTQAEPCAMNGQQNHYFVALGRRAHKPAFHSSQPTQQNDRGFVAFRVQRHPAAEKLQGVVFFIAAIGGVYGVDCKKISAGVNKPLRILAALGHSCETGTQLTHRDGPHMHIITNECSKVKGEIAGLVCRAWLRVKAAPCAPLAEGP